MSSAHRPRTTYKEKTMLNFLHVYTSPNHGSSVLRYWPVTHVTHLHLSTHLTHDPLTHCLHCSISDEAVGHYITIMNSIALQSLQAYYATVVEDRPILSAVYHLPLLITTDPPCSAVSLR